MRGLSNWMGVLHRVCCVMCHMSMSTYGRQHRKEVGLRAPPCLGSCCAFDVAAYADAAALGTPLLLLLLSSSTGCVFAHTAVLVEALCAALPVRLSDG